MLSLGNLYVSDFLKTEEHSSSRKKYPLELEMNKDIGAPRLTVMPPSSEMWGKYWYRSGTNATMKKDLKSIVDEICDRVFLEEGDLWCDIACFPEDNFITTSKGLIDIRDIKVGDSVLSHDGTFNKVSKLFKREFNGDFVKIKMRCFDVDFNCTHNHPFLTKRGWVAAENLVLTDELFGINTANSYDLDHICLNDMLQDYPHEVFCGEKNVVSTSNGNKSPLPNKVLLDENFSKIVGFYIGEGDSMGGAGIRFSFHIKEREKVDFIQRYFKETFSLESEIYSKSNTLVIRINSRLLSFIFQKLCGLHAKRKKIPFEILNSNTVGAFLHALWFTDGHFIQRKGKKKHNNKQYIYSSVSKKLALDLRELLLSLGIFSSVRKVKNNRGFSREDGFLYRLTVERNDSVKKLVNVFLGGEVQFSKGDFWIPITGLEKFKKSNTVYNFEVENTHSYVCNGVAVHNCNDGTLLSFVPEGIYRLGIDPADDSYYEESSKIADQVIQDYFSYESFTDSKFADIKPKVITTIAMFYDLEDPDSFIKDIYKVLHDDGVWIVQISYTPLMLAQMAFDNICHEHYYYHSLSSLKILFERNGLEIMDASLNDVNGGSIRVYAQKKIRTTETFGASPLRDVCRFRVESLLEVEKNKYDISKEEVWEEFAQKIESLKSEVVGFIKSQKAKGKTIAALGASTKGNTLLQVFGLDNSLIDCISERSPYKFGLKTVGTEIPILSEEEVREMNPDYILILPWHFIKEFKDREKEYLKGGGKFIVPCPKFEIIEE